jgi:hypothetical protein
LPPLRGHGSAGNVPALRPATCWKNSTSYVDSVGPLRFASPTAAGPTWPGKNSRHSAKKRFSGTSLILMSVNAHAAFDELHAAQQDARVVDQAAPRLDAEPRREVVAPDLRAPALGDRPCELRDVGRPLLEPTEAFEEPGARHAPREAQVAQESRRPR